MSNSHFEFGGKWGGVIMTLILPLLVPALNLLAESPSLGLSLREEILQIFERADEINLFSVSGCAAYLAWFALCVLLWMLVPGRWLDGQPLSTGHRLKYKINGMNSLLTILSIWILLAATGFETFFRKFVVDHFFELASTAIVTSFAIAFGVLIQSFRWQNHAEPKTLLANGGQTGFLLYDFFIGRPLNPRTGNFDWKSFCELRPGLFLWALIDLAYLRTAMAKVSASSISSSVAIRLTIPMFMVVAMHVWYVFDSVLNEPAVLSTMDITTDGFGFMLAFGDLAWVPFLYSLQARYIMYSISEALDSASTAVSAQSAEEIVRGATISPRVLALAVTVYAVGYWIFRSSNLQKNNFRSLSRDSRELQKISYIQTEYGTRLLTSGWWRVARHINYLGDWLMSWAFSIPCGFNSPIPYFYPIYFAVLLVHREMRDEQKCSRKYGKDWLRYKEIVPYRIIPYIY